jgi:hypothetical protein
MTEQPSEGTPTWPSSPTPAAAVPNAAPAGLPPAMPPAPQGDQMRPQTSTSAIIALVLSIASWIVCPLITSIVAIVMAYQADKEIRNSGGQVTGQGLSFAAKIIAWINIGVSVALIILAVIFGLVLLAAGGFGSVSA